MSGRSQLFSLALIVGRRRGSVTAIIGLIAVALSTCTVALAAVEASSDAAITQAVQGDFGYRAYALESADPAVAAAVADRNNIAPAVDSNGVLTASGLAADVRTRSTTDSTLKLGVLTSGTRPTRPGQGLVSEIVASSLGIKIGDTVTLNSDGGHEDVLVTGELSDPRDVTAQVVVRLVDDAGLGVAPSRWLLDENPYDDPDLQPLLDQASAKVASYKTAVPLALENQPRAVSTLGFLPTASFVIVGGLLLGAVIRLASRWRFTGRALQASGMSERATWLVFCWWMTLTVLIGVIMGTALAMMIVGFGKRPISQWIGQDWTTAAVPTFRVAIALLVPIAFVAAGPAVLRLVMTRRSIQSALTHQQRPPWWTVAAFVLAAAAWGYMTFLGPGGADVWLVPVVIAGLITVGVAPHLLATVLSVGLPKATRRLYRASLGGIQWVSAAAAAVVFVTGYWSAQTYDAASRGQSLDNALQPAGSLVLSDLPDNTIATIADFYGALGGDTYRAYQMPLEQASSVRVTSPKLSRCVGQLSAQSPDELPPRCWPDEARTATPVNAVVLGRGSEILADPGLVDSGQIGLLVFQKSADSSEIASAATVDARPDDTLGGVVAGLIVPSGGRLATEYGLVPSGVSQVIFDDYATLQPESRLRFRAGIGRIAPTALINDSTAPTSYDLLRSAAASGGIFGSAGVVLLLLLGGFASVQSAGSARRALQEMGTYPGVRWSLLTRWLLIPTGSGALGGALAYGTASWGGRLPSYDYGPLWAAPVASVFLMIGPLYAWLARPTVNEWDVVQA